MEIEFDPAKRARIRRERGLDMSEAGAVFTGVTITAEDDRKDYGERRYVTIGRLRGRLVVIVWTPRGSAYRIISMRKANEREEAAYGARV